MRPKRSLLPKDLEGDEIPDIVNYPNHRTLMLIAHKRTHRLALEVISCGRVTLRDALEAAYIQGLTDGALLKGGV